jgi:hypothetical protein
MEDWILEIALNLVSRFPVLGTILMVLGCVFVICEFCVRATPSKKDDEVLNRVMDGYLGKLINVIKKFSPFVKKV